jgi:hypothetical protein
LFFSRAEISVGQNADSIQHFLAVDLTGQEAEPLTAEEMEMFREAGITILLTEPETTLPSGEITDFNLILFSGNSYSTVRQIRSDPASLTENLIRGIENLQQSHQDHLAAIELFRFPNDRNPDFFSASAEIIDSLNSFTELPLFYSSAADSLNGAPGPFSYIAGIAAAGPDADYDFSSFVHFIPSENLRQTLQSLDQLLSVQLIPENSVIVLSADWLKTAMDSVPDLSAVLSYYTMGESIPMPLPAKTDEGPPANWSVVFLVLLWISVLLHMRFQPVYGQSMPRYFLHHPFYVIDVMEQRVRNSMPGMIVLVQHAVITALFIYVSADILITDLGLNALQAQLPDLFLFQSRLFSLSFAGFFIALILQGVSVLWIYLLNKELTNISQALNLYSWPLHVNLLIVTALVVLSQIGITGFWITVLGILFTVTWFMSFNMAAMDAAKFLKARVLYLILTLGIHVIIVMALIWYLFYTPDIYEALQMAFSFGKGV